MTEPQILSVTPAESAVITECLQKAVLRICCEAFASNNSSELILQCTITLSTQTSQIFHTSFKEIIMGNGRHAPNKLGQHHIDSPKDVEALDHLSRPVYKVTNDADILQRTFNTQIGHRSKELPQNDRTPARHSIPQGLGHIIKSNVSLTKNGKHRKSDKEHGVRFEASWDLAKASGKTSTVALHAKKRNRHGASNHKVKPLVIPEPKKHLLPSVFSGLSLFSVGSHLNRNTDISQEADCSRFFGATSDESDRHSEINYNSESVCCKDLGCSLPWERLSPIGHDHEHDESDDLTSPDDHCRCHHAGYGKSRSDNSKLCPLHADKTKSPCTCSYFPCCKEIELQHSLASDHRAGLFSADREKSLYDVCHKAHSHHCPELTNTTSCNKSSETFEESRRNSADEPISVVDKSPQDTFDNFSHGVTTLCLNRTKDETKNDREAADKKADISDSSAYDEELIVDGDISESELSFKVSGDHFLNNSQCSSIMSAASGERLIATPQHLVSDILCSPLNISCSSSLPYLVPHSSANRSSSSSSSSRVCQSADKIDSLEQTCQKIDGYKILATPLACVIMQPVTDVDDNSLLEDRMKKFPCPDCECSFSMLTNLRRHIKKAHQRKIDRLAVLSSLSHFNSKHSPQLSASRNIKPETIKLPAVQPKDSARYRHVCTLCEAAFTFRTNLTRHMKKVHGHIPIPP